MEKPYTLRLKKTKNKNLQIDIWILKCIIKCIENKKNGKYWQSSYLKIETV